MPWWSCTDSPTGRSTTVRIPKAESTLRGPIPERCRMPGLNGVPADRITVEARHSRTSPPTRALTPTARSPSSSTLSTMTPPWIRSRAGGTARFKVGLAGTDHGSRQRCSRRTARRPRRRERCGHPPTEARVPWAAATKASSMVPQPEACEPAHRRRTRVSVVRKMTIVKVIFQAVKVGRHLCARSSRASPSCRIPPAAVGWHNSR